EGGWIVLAHDWGLPSGSASAHVIQTESGIGGSCRFHNPNRLCRASCIPTGRGRACPPGGTLTGGGLDIMPHNRPMAALKTVYVCSACGGTNPKWLGRCPHCAAWNTLEE